MNGPNTFLVRSKAAGFLKKLLRSCTPLRGRPRLAVRTWIASFTASTTNLLPTQSPWLGGTRLGLLESVPSDADSSEARGTGTGDQAAAAPGCRRRCGDGWQGDSD